LIKLFADHFLLYWEKFAVSHQLLEWHLLGYLFILRLHSFLLI